MSPRLPLIVLLITFAANVGRADDALTKRVRGLAQPKIDKGETVGIVVGVVHGDRHEFFAFGRPSLDDDTPPDEKTIFEIGSITKVFTAIALADMVREKKVALDDPVDTLLPQGIKAPEKNGKKITLRLLSNHRSGLPRVIPKVVANDLIGKQPYEDVTSKDMFDFVAKAKLSHEPGTHFAYSNLGAGLLGTTLALREKMSYEEMITKKIAEPLGMRDTMMTVDSERSLRLAKPYNSRGKTALAWKFDSFAGAGALRSTCDDMMRFLDANLGIGTVPESLRIALDESTRPRADTDEKTRKVALGWMIELSRANPKPPELVWHNGGTGGFSSFFGFIREKKCGVVVLGNSDSSVDEIGFGVLAQLARE